MSSLKNILSKSSLNKQDLITLLSITDTIEQKILFQTALQKRNETIGNKVYLRGLIEYSNVCKKNCYYCGIRRDNKKTERYTITNEEVLACAEFAYKENYGSVVIQAGERTDENFISNMEYLITEIKKLSNNSLGITLSLGEQTEETYKRWFIAGAHRYLIRIETSNSELYGLLHPNNDLHNYNERIKAIEIIKKVGYQVGTGVMIGLPHQTIEQLADDLLFFKQMDIDMVGMGPYIEHEDTPLYAEKNILFSKQERFELSLRMIATLRLLMPDINMAATTALQSIDPVGREKAINSGANIIMPNLTPVKYRENYLLYEDKPCLDEDAAKCTGCMILRIKSTGSDIGLGEWGDSKHFTNKQ